MEKLSGLVDALRKRVAELEYEVGYKQPSDPGDPSYPNPVDVAACLRNCSEDLLTEARFVLWQAREIDRLGEELRAARAAIEVNILRILKDNGYTKYEDGIVESDLVDAVVAALYEHRAVAGQHSRTEVVMEEIMWWGYLHQNGTVQVKRWFGDHKDYTSNCRGNDFIQQVVPPFAAPSREEAIEIVTGRVS